MKDKMLNLEVTCDLADPEVINEVKKGSPYCDFFNRLFLASEGRITFSALRDGITDLYCLYLAARLELLYLEHGPELYAVNAPKRKSELVALYGLVKKYADGNNGPNVPEDPWWEALIEDTDKAYRENPDKEFMQPAVIKLLDILDGKWRADRSIVA